MTDTADSSLPTTGETLVSDHWYLHFWPWVLITIPFSAVLFGILMVVMVASYPDDLVVDNYYKDGMAINQILTLDKNAAKSGITARMIDQENDALKFLVSNANDSALVLNLFHVTDSELDTSVLLYPRENGVYSTMPSDGGDVAKSLHSDKPKVIKKVLSSTGIWYIELNGVDEPWRLRARLITPVATLTMGEK